MARFEKLRFGAKYAGLDKFIPSFVGGIPATPLEESTGFGALVVGPGFVTVVQLGLVDPDNVASDRTDTTSRHFTSAPPLDETDVVSQRNAADKLAAAATLLTKTVELSATAPTAFFRNENLVLDTRFICWLPPEPDFRLVASIAEIEVIEKATIADYG